MRRIAFGLFFLSGALGLLYEVVWLRLLVLFFGSTHFAVTAVLTAVMAGQALGALAAGRYVDRINQHPLRVYGLLEVGVGASALCVPLMLAVMRPAVAILSPATASSFYIGSVLRFLLALAVLIAPTMLMGAALPTLSRVIARRHRRIEGGVGWLYAVNVFGAVAGTALTGFVLLPSFGTAATVVSAGLVNVALGAVALVVAAASRHTRSPDTVDEPSVQLHRRRGPPGDRGPGRDDGHQAVRGPGRDDGHLALWVVALSGALAMVYEIAWTRVLGLVLGSSVYAFTVMLSTFLVGLACGAALGVRTGARAATAPRVVRILVVVVGLGSVAGFLTLHALPALPPLFASWFHALDLTDGAAAGRLARLATLEFLVASLVMLPAAVTLGMVFPLALRLRVTGPRGIGRAVGTLSAANAAGTIIGATAAGFVLLPWLGLQGGVLAAVVAGVALAMWIDARRPQPSAVRVWGGRGLAAAAIVVAVTARPAWDPLVMNSGVFQYAPELTGHAVTRDGFRAAQHDDTEVLHYEEGLTANVLVARQRSNGNVWMSIDGKLDASSRADLPTQLLLGHLPMLWLDSSAAAAPSAIVIGFASGITTGAVTRYAPSRVTAVEIEPAVVRASAFFDHVNHTPLADPAVELVEGDGRTWLISGRTHYDAIISEPSNPWMTIAANLFTREFFEAGRDRLVPGGVFSQWIQLYGLQPADLRSLVATFASVFPRVSMFWAIPGRDIVLLGSEGTLEVDLGRLDVAFGRPSVAADLARIDVRGTPDLLTYYLAGDAGTRAFARDAPINTDDNALIEFRAPLSLHADTGPANVAALERVVMDPLAEATGLPTHPEARAERYTALGRAFYRRTMYARAVAAIRRAEALHPTDTGALRLESYEQALR